MAFDLSLFLFKKNETVIGMMGQTHGVNRAINPPSKPSININHQAIDSVGAVLPLKAWSSEITGDQRSEIAMVSAGLVIVSLA